MSQSWMQELGNLSDHLICVTACLVGLPVEVQVKNGSIYSGIFHTASAEKDYGVVLKMAWVTTHSNSLKGASSEVIQHVRRQPVKALIIYAKDLVQIIAKDVPLNRDALKKGRASKNCTELVTDSYLSQGWHGEPEHELKPWSSDKDNITAIDLESGTSNRKWDQFETNKRLFHVTSTYDENLYTTRLETGPETREHEREALRIAHEIEQQKDGLHKTLESMDEKRRFLPELLQRVDIDKHSDETSLEMYHGFEYSTEGTNTNRHNGTNSEESLNVVDANLVDGSESEMPRSSHTDLNKDVGPSTQHNKTSISFSHSAESTSPLSHSEASFNSTSSESRLNPNATPYLQSFMRSPSYEPILGMPPAEPRYTVYNSMNMAAGTSASPVLLSPGPYVQGAVMQPAWVRHIPRQTQLQVIGYPVGSQQEMFVPAQPAPTYHYSSGQWYSEPRTYIYGGLPYQQPRTYVYGGPPHHQVHLSPIPHPAQAASQQHQSGHHGVGAQGIQYGAAPPFVEGVSAQGIQYGAAPPFVEGVSAQGIPNSIWCSTSFC